MSYWVKNEDGTLKAYERNDLRSAESMEEVSRSITKDRKSLR